MFESIKKLFVTTPVVEDTPLPRIKTPKTVGEVRKHLRRILQMERASQGHLTSARRAEYKEDVRCRKLMLDAYGLSGLTTEAAVVAALDALNSQGDK
jgi:hypothetical protein